jgi:hypothetical protein
VHRLDDLEQTDTGSATLGREHVALGKGAAGRIGRVLFGQARSLHQRSGLSNHPPDYVLVLAIPVHVEHVEADVACELALRARQGVGAVIGLALERVSLVLLFFPWTPLVGRLAHLVEVFRGQKVVEFGFLQPGDFVDCGPVH